MKWPQSTNRKRQKKREKKGTTEDRKGIKKKKWGQKREGAYRIVKLPKKTTLKKGIGKYG